jgi:peptide/nickel transport system substrate-binding protein
VDDVVVTDRGYDAIGAINYLEFFLRKPPFDNIRVRRAIAHAIDKEFITQKLHKGLSHPATGPLVRMFPYYTEDVKKYEYDLREANKMLDDAGYPRKADGKRFSATMRWFPEESNQKLLAEYLRTALAKIGIDIQLVPPADFGTWIKAVANWDHELTMNMIFSYGDPVIGVHRLYLCDNIKKIIWTNTEGYCNPKADEIVTKAGEEINFEKRKALYADWQRILTEELPLIWTHEVPYYTIYNKELRDVPLGIWGFLTAFDKIYWKDGKEPK